MLSALVVGNLGKDAELKVTQGGKAVCNFSVAAKNKKTDETVWVRCALWGSHGEKMATHLTKGTRVAVNGALSTREYQGKTYLELEVNQLEMQGGGTKGGDDAPSPKPTRAPKQEDFADYGSDDDVPF